MRFTVMWLCSSTPSLLYTTTDSLKVQISGCDSMHQHVCDSPWWEGVGKYISQKAGVMQQTSMTCSFHTTEWGYKLQHQASGKTFAKHSHEPAWASGKNLWIIVCCIIVINNYVDEMERKIAEKGKHKYMFCCSRYWRNFIHPGQLVSVEIWNMWSSKSSVTSFANLTTLLLEARCFRF